MKILFDHQIFSQQRFGGVSKYFCEILKNIDKSVWETSTYFSNNEYMIHSQLFSVHSFFPFIDFKKKKRLMLELGKPYSIYKILKSDFDVFHQTNYYTYCFKYIRNKPIITTCHDLVFFHYFPERLHKRQRESMEKASHIITISEFSKKELIEHWNIPIQKISVIYHGIEHINIDRSVYHPLFDFPYILYVGTRYSYKNFNRFLSMFNILHRRYPYLKLICTGLSFSKEESQLIANMKISDSIISISATETEMNILYRDAQVFVFPSIYEGFGMPLLESMVQNCPIACSSIDTFHEIAGDAVSYFNPHDEFDMFTAIERILTDSNFKQSIVKKGKLRVQDFSWEESARKHLEVYKLYSK